MLLWSFSVQQTTYRIGNHVYYWVWLRPDGKCEENNNNTECGLGGANPVVNTPRPSRGTRIESCDFIALILLVCFILLGLACRVGAMGSIYLLCLTCRLRRLTVWSLIFLGGFILFSNYRVCVNFSGSFYLFLICVPFLGS